MVWEYESKKGGILMGLINYTAKGDFIQLNDSSNNKIEYFSLYGKLTQESTTGKNLLENTAESQTVNGVTFTVNEDGSVTANGTATDTVYNPVLCDINLNAGEKYIISGGISNTKKVTIHYQADYTQLNVSSIGGDREVTIPITGVYRIYIYTYTGEIYDNETFYPMLRLASIADATYEPYTGSIASPNPDYPQEIEVAGGSGSVEVKSVGKNILNPAWLPTKIVNGVTCTNNGDNTWTFSGSETGDSLAYGFSATFTKETTPIQFKKAGYYRLSVTGMSLGTADQYFYVNLHYNGVNHLNMLNSESTAIMQITEEMLSYDDFYVHSLGFYVTPTKTAKAGTVGVQIEYGDMATEFEPYKETTSAISTPNGLPGIPVSSDGNYTDENGQQWICDSIVKYADGTGKYVQRFGKTVLDGSDDEGWGMSGSVVGRMYGRIWTTNGTKNFISNMCYQVSTYPDSVVGKAFIGADGNINIMTAFTDATTWKSYIASSPMTVWYELAKPIIIYLTEEEIAEIEKLQTFYPVTNITNDAGCGMEVTYKSIFYEWLMPKTNWKSTDRFNISDYNRIKGNILYLHKLSVSLWKPFNILDMGEDLTDYTVYFDVDIFNYFESNLETINQNILTQDFGISQRFYENAPFIKWDELNRIESAMLSIYELLQRQKLSIRKIPFRLGAFKEVRI